VLTGFSLNQIGVVLQWRVGREQVVGRHRANATHPFCCRPGHPS
jgi:hypothetical protein